MSSNPDHPHAALEGLYDELRAIARRRLAGLPPGQTLQPTALVNEAWMRVAGRDSPLPPGGRALMFLISRAMRDTLVEDARRKGALKRGGERVELGAEPELPAGDPLQVLAVHEALEALEREDPEHAEVVALRYFGGLSVPEVAEALGCSTSSVERRWTYARAWLRRRMDGAQGGGEGRPPRADQ